MDINEKTIQIDWGVEPLFGHDELFVTYPHRFMTVMFMLRDTDDLNATADAERAKAVKKPLYSEDGTDAEDEGLNDGYSFYVGVSEGGTVDNCITVLTTGDECFYLELSEDERGEMLNVLDKACLDQYGKTCIEMIKEVGG